jgi:predicted transcriptional regulator
MATAPSVQRYHRLRWVIASALAVALYGCTIVQLHSDEKAEAAKVNASEIALQAEQQRADALNRRKNELTDDLTKGQLSLDELNQRVDQLRAATAQDMTANASVRRARDADVLERKRLIEKIQDGSAQIAALQQSPDDSNAEKLARIAFLKRQIGQQLDLLLH